jgi:hypothetical protein
MIIHDPTLYEMQFFALPPNPKKAQVENLRAFLNRAARHFVESVGAANSPDEIDTLDAFEDQFIKPLTSVDPEKTGPGLWLGLDARTMLHDTIMLRTTALYEGDVALAQVGKLDFSTPLAQLQVALPYYLGRFRILYGETDAPEDAERAELAMQLARAVCWTWFVHPEPMATPLGTLVFGAESRRSQQQPVPPALDLVMVGPRQDAKTVDRKRSRPFLFTLPLLSACHLKVRNSVDSIRHHGLRKISTRERKLRSFLPKEKDLAGGHIELLKNNKDIMKWQARLVDAVVAVQAELRTMRINRDDFDILATGPYRDVSEKLKQILIGRWMRPTEVHAENEIGYAEGALRLAESHFESIEASAAADQARATRWTNRLLILLGIGQFIVAMLAAYLAWKQLTAPVPAAPALNTKDASATPAQKEQVPPKKAE